MRSMTGFGQASMQVAQGKINVEIRSLNHRFFDAVLHLPNGFNQFDDKIRKELQKRISRGRINLSISYIPSKSQKVVLNKALAQNYIKTLRQLNKKLRLKDDIGLSHLLALQGVLTLSENNSQVQLWPALKRVINAALVKLIRMRDAEGKSVERDIAKHLARLGQSLQLLAKESKNVIKRKSKNLPPDDCSMFLKSTDINEEIARLGFHVKNFNTKQAKDHAQGKELDFITQEMQREVNTIGAKLPDSKISYFVVTMKSLVEKMREQLQNVE
ncbi:YicC/YloC family endoribonuclease [Candidatus Omnitrophota bacterium]